MRWANFLHIYQPPTQKPFWIHKVAAESYRKIFKGLKDSPKAKLTLNANGVLLEHLDVCGEHDILDDMRLLMDRGQLELTGSAKYHPLLPFLPESEIVRQIEINDETHRKYFGNRYKRRGFFPPEMGFTKEVARTVSKLGFKWIIADELSFPRGRQIDYSKIYTVEGLGDFQIYFRERRMSWVILSGQVGTGNLLVESLADRLKRPEYLLTAMDGETFGHHRPGLEQLLFEVYRSPHLETVFVSDLPQYFKFIETVDPVPSTWALMEKDLQANKPFSRWYDEDNVIHSMQWDLTRLAIKTGAEAGEGDQDYARARSALDKSLHSDQYWWASARPWWSIEMIERGAKELYDAVILMPGASDATKEKAKNLYYGIVFTAFDWQREGVVDALSRVEDEDIRQRTDVGLPKLPKREIDKMIKGLEKEMKLLAGQKEFERAAQIRDRIEELGRYAGNGDGVRFSSEGDREWQEGEAERL